MPEPVSPIRPGQLRTRTRHAWRFKRELDWNLCFQQFQANRKLPVFGIGFPAYILLDESLTQDERQWMKKHPSRVTPITCWVLPYKEEDMEALLGQPVSFLPDEGTTLVQVPDWILLVELRQFPFPQTSTNGTPGKITSLNFPALKFPALVPKPGQAHE